MRILVTRPDEEGRAMARALLAQGHDPVLSPALEIVSEPPRELHLDGFQAILATSRHGAEALSGNRAALRLPLLAVGRATARTARAVGFATVLSADGDRHTLVRMACDTLEPMDGALLWAAGRDRTPELAEDLAAHGFAVEVIEVYRAEAARELTQEARRALAAGAVDAVAVHSPRSAAILLSLFTDAGVSAEAGPAVHAVSEATAKPFRAAGWTRIVVARTPDSRAMMETFETDAEP